MKNIYLLGVLCGMLALCCGNLAAQSSSFTYQGLLNINNNAAKDPVDLRFELYNAAAEGVQIGSVNYIDDLNIVNGVFTANLDFGSDAFDGSERWVEIGARPGSADNSDRNGYETLAPRQRLTPAPYALQSDRATTATIAENAAKLNNLASSYFARATHTHTGVYSPTVHTHRASDTTSGAFPDERIADDITISDKGSVDGAAIKQGVVAEKYIDPIIARATEAQKAIADHAGIANAHHTWPLTDANIPDNITINGSGSISGKAIKSDTVGDAFIPSSIARDSELAYEAVVAPTGGDYTTIQAALAAGKKTILVRNGTYVLASDIDITQNGIIIVGESRNGVIIDCNNTAYGIKAKSSPFFASTISINKGTSTVTGSGTNWLTSLSEVSRAYIMLHNVCYKVASIPDNTTIILADVYRGKNISDSPMKVGYILNDIRLENLTLANYTFSGDGAFSFYGTTDVVIKNCAAINCTSYGIKTSSSSNFLIQNNFFKSNRTALFFEESYYINASGNYCLNSILSGILLTLSNYCTINGNQCLNNSSNGISLDGSANNTMTDNNCRGNETGIYTYGSDGNTINANHCNLNIYNGIWIYNNSDYNTIINNICWYNDNYGVNIQESTSSFNIVGMNSLMNNNLGPGRDEGASTQQKSTNYPAF